ncbi:hypothetical protein UCRPC4_g05780 [Phaeomoniella chlamydospora]|uniref:Uncharacterized protein n=1 Tax=Phaeomoniella chlamydospora TaxID=158046 RepID=A0A0G2E184_PHACM|nr:hypothetical protein UCRPC4_g05780 [Phaeomoniella chlamydospora]
MQDTANMPSVLMCQFDERKPKIIRQSSLMDMLDMEPDEVDAAAADVDVAVDMAIDVDMSIEAVAVVEMLVCRTRAVQY